MNETFTAHHHHLHLRHQHPKYHLHHHHHHLHLESHHHHHHHHQHHCLHLLYPLLHHHHHQDHRHLECHHHHHLHLPHQHPKYHLHHHHHHLHLESHHHHHHLLVGGMVLLGTEFICQPGSINHSLLGLVLGVLGLVEAVINLGMKGVASGFQLPLLIHGLGVDGSHVIDSRPGLCQLHLALLLAPVSGVQKSPGLFQLTVESIGLALCKSGLLGDLHMLAVLFLKSSLHFTELVLVALDGLLCLGISLVGMVKGNLQFIDVGFKFLLDAKCFSLGPGLSLQRSLHGVHSPLVVLASVVELFFLLLNLPVNLLPDLSKFKLGTQDLVLLLLKSSFGFLKGSLELLLLNLQATALFVKLVNGPATISQLVQEILDFISQVLVLPLDNIQLLNSLIPSGLEAEHLAV